MWRAQRGRLGNKDGRSEANDLAFERNTLSTANGLELLDGGDDSPEFAEAAKDCRVWIWNVKNMYETSGWFWICVAMVIAILTVLSGGPFAKPISDDCRRQKETDENAAWRRPMKNELKHHQKVSRSGLCVEPCWEVWRFHVDHDMSCESQ